MPDAPRKRRWPRVLAVLVLLLVAAGLTLFVLVGRRPAWWRDPGANAAGSAERVENALVSELSLARPSDGSSNGYQSREWTMTISQDEANAWLATRLKGWVQNRGMRWPRAVDGVRAGFRDGEVLLGVESDGRFVSASVVPEVRADKSLWLKVEGMSLGGMPLPAEFLVSRLRGAVGGSSGGELLEALEGRRAVMDRAVIAVDETRVVRIVRIEAREGSVVLTCRTERAD